MIKKSEQAKVLTDLGLDQSAAEQVIACSAAAADMRHEARVEAVLAEVSDLDPLARVVLLRMEEAARKGRLAKTPPTVAFVGGGSGRRHALDGGAWAAAISDAARLAGLSLGEEDPYLAGVSISARFAGCGPAIRWAFEAAVVVALDNQRHQLVQQAAAQAAFYLWAQAESDSAWAVNHYACPGCGAAAGDPCRRPNGAPTPLAHLGRVALLSLATDEEPVADEEEEVAAQAGE